MRQTKYNEEIGRLADLPRPELARRWQAIYGAPPPPGIKRPLLERAVAWHLQAKAFGGLSASHLRTLRSSMPCQCGPAVDGRMAITSRPPVLPPRSSLRPGARLVREWHGHSHVVDVTQGGFVWSGRKYASLSAIAREITGTRWSGPRFFGL